MDFARMSETPFQWYRALDSLSTAGTQSPIGQKLVTALNRFSVYPATQFKIGNCTVDICLPDDKIVVECDGAAFHTDKEKDRRRDRYITKQGYWVLRYTGSEIHRDALAVASKIISHMAGTNPENDKYIRKMDEDIKTNELLEEQDLCSDKF